MSKLITNTVRHTAGSADNITLDNSQNVTVEGNLTVDGNISVTGTGLTDATKMPLTGGTFTGVVNVTRSGNDAELSITAEDNRSAALLIQADDADDNADKSRIYKNKDTGKLHIQNYGSGSWEDNIVCSNDNTVEIYHDNAVAAYTGATGLHVQGTHNRITFHDDTDTYIERPEGNTISFVGGGTQYYRIKSTGESTWYTGDDSLTVVIGGATRMQLRHTGGGDVTWSNPSSGSATYSTSSDYRLKQDVVALPNALSTVKALKPYEYKWKHNTSKTSQGFFAHEVIETVPNSQAGQGTKDAVDSDSNPVYQQIDYSRLVPVLTKALQEAITKIETLETKVAALEAA